MFEKARIKLTAWYLVIIMVVSLIFSLGIYQNISNEYIRFDRSERTNQERFEHQPSLGRPDFQRINFDEARARLISSLILVNLIILVSAGLGGYFLAGKTLKPIKEMMDNQNRFVSDASHELRTPITALRSEIEVALRNKGLTATQAKNVMRSNLEEVDELQKLSEYLISLLQDETVLGAILEPVNLGDVVRESISKVEKIAKAKQIKIINKSNNLTINADYQSLVKVLVILLDNAIKYSPNKTEITINSLKQKDSVDLMVKDQGMGMDEETASLIFDRFYRAEDSRTHSGYGLGLSIAKKIIEDLHGSIRVKSTKDKGSTFIINLPLVKS